MTIDLIPKAHAAPGGLPEDGKFLGDMLKVNEQGVGVDYVFNSVSSFINLLVPLSFIIAGLIVLFFLIGGGFAIVAGGGDAKSVENGQKQITNAVLGFVVIFAAYWIIKIVEIITGIEIFNPSYF